MYKSNPNTDRKQVSLPYKNFDLPFWTPSRKVEKEGILTVCLHSGSTKFQLIDASGHGLPNKTDFEIVYRLIRCAGDRHRIRIVGTRKLMSACGYHNYSSKDVQRVNKAIHKVMNVSFSYVSTSKSDAGHEEIWDDKTEDQIMSVSGKPFSGKHRRFWSPKYGVYRWMVDLDFRQFLYWTNSMWHHRLSLPVFSGLPPFAARLYEYVSVHLVFGSLMEDGVTLWKCSEQVLISHLATDDADTNRRRFRSRVRQAIDQINEYTEDHEFHVDICCDNTMYVFGKTDKNIV